MKKKFLTYITNSAPYQWTISLLKKIRFKKADVNLYDVIRIFIDKLTKDEVIERAEAVAFNFTLAIFPAILFLFTLIPFIHDWIPDVSVESIMEFIGQMMPQNMYEVISSTVLDIIGKQRGGLLTFGFVFSLFLATNGMMALIKAFNACYKTVEKRGFLKTRFIATALTMMLAIVLVLAIVLLVVGNIMIDFIQHLEWFDIDNYLFLLFLALRFIVIFIVFFLAISFIYYFGPAVHYNWRFFSIGSFVATLLCLLVSYGFSYYVANFSTYNKLYGSIGVLIALMIWQFILSVVLLIGYELNASIHKAHSIHGDQAK
ncbi:YihY/virulence factor BrkB family protein [Fulvivirgaceae bacterium BMA10]|uniref:YihY/virulence factor BrkB family protein n=1 Tax=Splendidivirga corallicola TaxID=3051826 RepID=A0ABT8KJ03_9BACT|nr:YihY/virulence factor BrkB family protein [Fulvivirgaceae bacterium BMA10]